MFVLRICTLVVVLILSSLESHSVRISDSPTFNAALEADVHVIPDDAFCGIDIEDEYCASFEGSGSVNSCDTAYCDLECRYSSSKLYQDAFSWRNAIFTSCVHQTNFAEAETFGVGRAPEQHNESLIRFDGSGGNDCSFLMDGGWMTHIALRRFIEFSVSFWIWPESIEHQ